MSRLAVAFHCGWSILEFHTFVSHESPSTCVFGVHLEGRLEALYHIGYQILEDIVVTDHAASFGSILVFHIACQIDNIRVYVSIMQSDMGRTGEAARSNVPTDETGANRITPQQSCEATSGDPATRRETPSIGRINVSLI